MKEHIRPALVLLALFTLITGIAYPLALTGIASVVFPERATGSVIVDGGKERGSRLMGQSFESPRYFWGRLSATSPVPFTGFNAGAGTGSSGSNMGPAHPGLRAAAEARIAALRAADPTNTREVPADIVTASASGLDPHISPAAAEYQVSRVAHARGVSEERVRELVARHTEERTLGLLGEPRVNVLGLNLELDAELGGAPR